MNCPLCNVPALYSTEVEVFPALIGRETQEIRVIVPVHTCNSCHEMWTDHHAEVIRQDAVDRALSAAGCPRRGPPNV